MSPLLSWFIFFALVILVLGTYLSLIAGKKIKASAAEYYVAGRSLGTLVLLGTAFASLVSAFGFLGLPGFAFVHGIAMVPWILFADGWALLILYPIAYRVWLVGGRFGLTDPAHILSERYGSSAVGLVASLILVLFTIPFMGVQMIGIGGAVSQMLGPSAPSSSVLYASVAVVIFIFTFFGGMRAVAWTDSLLGIVMGLAILLGIFYFPFVAFGGWAPMFAQAAEKIPAHLSIPGGAKALSMNAFLSMSLIWTVFFICQPHITHRYLSAGSKKSIMTLGWGLAICVLALSISGLMFGLGGKILYPAFERPDMIAAKIIGDWFPPALGGLLIAGTVAACISTVDSILLANASVLARHVYGRYFDPNASQAKQVMIGRVGVVVLLVITVIFSLQKVPMMGLLVLLSTAGVGQLAPAYIGALYWKRATATGAIISALSGTGMLAILELTLKKPYLGIASGLWALVVSTVVFVVVSLLTKAPKDKAEEWIDYLDKEIKGSSAASQAR